MVSRERIRKRFDYRVSEKRRDRTEAEKREKRREKRGGVDFRKYICH